MRIKHWTYFGVALIVANGLFLEHVRAAEIAPGQPFYRQFPFELLHFPMDGFWRKPLPEIVSPVRVRLFANQKCQALWLKAPTGFIVSGEILRGPLTISIQNQKLSVFKNGKREMIASRLVIRALNDCAFTIKTRSGAAKWTRGEVALRVIKGHILAVNRLGMEDYVSGILEGELGTLDLSPDVLKAQIVVARSYVLSMRGEQHNHEGYEFCDGPHCQMFTGLPMSKSIGLEVAL